jgi:hypothetical protein
VFAIVTKSIILTEPPGLPPPPHKPLVFDDAPAVANLLEPVKSPKYIAFPVVAIVTYSIIYWCSSISTTRYSTSV